MASNATASAELVCRWIEQCVIDLSLCPFASLPYRAGRVRIAVCGSDSETDYLAQIESELIKLIDDAGEVETTLIVAEKTLIDFLDFNDFLTDVESLLQQDDRQAAFQMASFHPQYQFAGVDAEDAGNYTNRAPFPVVQWLRADTVAKAVAGTDTLAIPEANIQKLKSMSIDECRKLFPWVR